MTITLILLIVAMLGAFLGFLLGVLLAARHQRPTDRREQLQPEPIDEYTAAAIDQAAVKFAVANGRPNAAPLIANKLRLLHQLGRRREQ